MQMVNNKKVILLCLTKKTILCKNTKREKKSQMKSIQYFKGGSKNYFASRFSAFFEPPL